MSNLMKKAGTQGEKAKVYAASVRVAGDASDYLTANAAGSNGRLSSSLVHEGLALKQIQVAMPSGNTPAVDVALRMAKSAVARINVLCQSIGH